MRRSRIVGFEIGMSSTRFLSAVAVGVLCMCAGVANARAQTSTHHAAATTREAFAPLETWKTAVLAGDKSTLSNLYSSNPPAKVTTPAGESSGPDEEAGFWSSLRAAGLKALDVKTMLRQTTPEGITELALRMYLTVQTASGPQDYVVSASQMWAKNGGTWQIVGTQRGDPGLRPKLTLPEPAVPNTNLYPDAAEAPKELKSALAAAKVDHKNVILVFGANWCFDCHVLDTAFRKDASIAPIVKANYHVVHVNIGEYDKNLDLAERYEVPLKKGVPELAVLDSQGKLLTSSKQGEFESSVKIGPADVTAFLNKWKPAARATAIPAKQPQKPPA